jgi:hypothetical protein
VFVEVRQIDGEYVEGFSASSWIELQKGLAERAANPPPDDPDEIPLDARSAASPGQSLPIQFVRPCPN